MKLVIILTTLLSFLACSKKPNNQQIHIDNSRPDSSDYEYWQPTSIADSMRDTIYTWIEEYANGKIDTLFKAPYQFKFIEINKTLNEYSFKCHMYSLGKTSVTGVTHDTIFVNYSDKRIITKTKNIVDKKNVVDFVSNLDSLMEKSEYNFAFEHGDLAYSFIDKPDWITYHQGIAYFKEGEYSFVGYMTSHEGCCQGRTYPRIVQPLDGDKYTLFVDTKDVDVGIYNWKIVVTNFYKFSDTLDIETRVLE